jgi:hypothetical protein
MILMKKQKATTKNNEDWFLETSVTRNLFFGHSLQKNDIRAHLNDAKSWSSQYVRMEYKRSVVKTLIDMYYVALEEDTPSDVIKWFSQSYKIREAKTVLSAIGELANQEDVRNNKEKFLVQLQMLIESAHRHLDNLVEFVRNETGCPLAKASISKSYKTFLDEIECRTLCHVESLWRKSKGRLKRLTSDDAKQTYQNNKGFMKYLEIVEIAVGDPNAPKTKVNCKRVGDFIIALEMPKDYRMLTTDRAFEAICNILNQNVFRLRSLSELRQDRAQQNSA